MPETRRLTQFSDDEVAALVAEFADAIKFRATRELSAINHGTLTGEKLRRFVAVQGASLLAEVAQGHDIRVAKHPF